MNSSDGLLAPPPTTATKTTMSNASSSDSASESGRSSPNSSRSDSPLVTFDRAFDTSDPLSFLMDSVNADVLCSGDSSAEESFLTTSTPPSSHDSPSGDWSVSGAVDSKNPAAALWAHPDLSSMSFDNYGGLNLMDFDPSSLGVSLGFDSLLYSNEALALPLDSLNPTDLSPYSFSFSTEGFTDLNTSSTDTSSRRLSITSSSSSSGVSLSPLLESTQTSPAAPSAQPASLLAGQPQLSGDQAMDELAQRARQIVGVSMALSIGMDATNGGHAQSAKIPIPRMQCLTPASSTSSNENLKSGTSPLPSSASSTSSQTNVCSSIPTPATGSARTKTSHTTIERRYRTNLNARIQSLRAAVPALRVLEQKAGNRVGNLSLKAGTRRVGVDVDAVVPGEEEDVIDERGFVDGVRVARKGSKANVLGKAVEYIRVLKRREHRLKREQMGLKALVRSLVGGPALVKEWETMWRERFGGPEKDEVEGEDDEADDENEDGEEDEDVEDKEERDDVGSGIGKKRKRAKVEALSVKGKAKKVAAVVPQVQSHPIQPVPIMPAQPFSIAPNPAGTVSMSMPIQPEKRRRGRPRKVPLPQVVAPNGLAHDIFAVQQYQQYQQQQPITMAPTPTNNVKMETDGASMSLGASTASEDMQSPAQHQNSRPGQYLLAAFAFFSFFNSPVSFYASSSSDSRRPDYGGHAHEHTHAGSVLGGVLPEASTASWSSPPPAVVTFGWRDAVQIIHIAVSFLLLVSVIAPWLPHVTRVRIARLVPRSLKPILGGPFIVHSGSEVTERSTHPTSSASLDDESTRDESADTTARMVLLAALSRGREFAPAQEAQVLRDALGLGTGMLGLIMSLTRQVGSHGKSRSRFGLERRMLEQRAFLRLAELVALDANAPVTTRIQTYLYAFKFLSVFSASAGDISTLALVVQPLWLSKSTSLWALALSRAQGKGFLSPHISRTFETFVLESMTVDEAVQKIAKLDMSGIKRALGGTAFESDEDDGRGYREPAGPLAVLASQVVRDYVREEAEFVFLQTVTGDVDRELTSKSDPDAADRKMHRIIAAGRSLDARTAVLVDLFEQVCNPTSSHFAHAAASDKALDEDAEAGQQEDADGDSELRALLRAVVLYRRIFPSTLLSVSPGEGESCKPASIMMPSLSAAISISLTPMPSPPPSPSRRNAALHLALRRCLDSAAFDRWDALEDARDRVVDMLTSEAAGWPKRLQY